MHFKTIQRLSANGGALGLGPDGCAELCTSAAVSGCLSAGFTDATLLLHTKTILCDGATSECKFALYYVCDVWKRIYFWKGTSGKVTFYKCVLCTIGQAWKIPGKGIASFFFWGGGFKFCVFHNTERKTFPQIPVLVITPSVSHVWHQHLTLK